MAVVGVEPWAARGMMPAMRIVGRSEGLACRRRCGGRRRFADDVARWTRRADRQWCDGHAVDDLAPLPGATAPPRGHRRQSGCLRLGPLWLPRLWLADAATYRRAIGDAVAGLSADGTAGSASPEFVPKAAAELGPLLRLWPHVLAVPTTAALSPTDLIRLRAWPVHPLGIVTRRSWADGGPRTPLEFFCHDLDHARFKVREDLLACGIAIADAYVDGGTFDAATGRHRTFLAAAARHVDGAFWRLGPVRAALADDLLAGSHSLGERSLGAAVRWLLFELVHEKSLPLAPAVLVRELTHDGHVRKLAAKSDRAFYDAHTPAAAVVGRLEDARHWLLQRLGARR